MANQEQAATSTMKDKLQKPQSELKLLQEHMKKEMAQWDHERSSFNHLAMERSKEWTKKMVIHVLTLAHQAEKLEPFLATPKTEEEHHAKKLVKDIMDVGNRAEKFL
ncbi:hypothetical protein V6N12_009999 [Hibiscus sabdariffa]|uniref:Uncharacterized protein n=1 Tax=Hibiscus sabdariffa TaxID=183260 RepID=A0ABR2ECF5_9ROSI